MTPAALPVTAPAPFDALPPLWLLAVLLLTPEQFQQVCAENPEAVLELAADGHMITRPPNGSETGARSSELNVQLMQFAWTSGRSTVFDSSTCSTCLIGRC